jgi:hypothetical protein
VPRWVRFSDEAHVDRPERDRSWAHFSRGQTRAGRTAWVRFFPDNHDPPGRPTGRDAVSFATVHRVRIRERSHCRNLEFESTYSIRVFHCRAQRAGPSRAHGSSAPTPGPRDPTPGAGPASARGAAIPGTNPLRKLGIGLKLWEMAAPDRAKNDVDRAPSATARGLPFPPATRFRAGGSGRPGARSGRGCAADRAGRPENRRTLEWPGNDARLTCPGWRCPIHEVRGERVRVRGGSSWRS